MWENCYYKGGYDDGVLNTPAGKVGVALCWELVRTQTLRRLMDKVDLVVGGSCWWDLPDNFDGDEADAARADNLNRLKDTPSRFAKILGVPVVHAAHAGELDGFNPFDQEMPYRSRFLGQSQIVDGRGNILARRSYEEKEGVVLAEITQGRVPGIRSPIPDGFWIPDIPEAVLKAWDRQNEFGRDYYSRVTMPHRRTKK
jgi:predicted amidohydrolase